MGWQYDELVALVRRKFPEWAGFAGGAWSKEQRADQRRVARLLTAETIASSTTLITQLEKIGRTSSLLWTGQRESGDLQLLYRPSFDPAAFHTAFMQLLDGAGTVAERLQQYSRWTAASDLPNRWAFPTYFLAMREPTAAFFVKPALTKWFLHFMNVQTVWQDVPDAAVYSQINTEAHHLFTALAPYQPADLLDIHAFLTVAHAAHQTQKGRLSGRAATELDQPPTVYRSFAEPKSEYTTGGENMSTLAYPFNQIFASYADAQTAFALLQRAIKTIGWGTEDDPRWSLTIVKRGKYTLGFNIGSWVAVRFYTRHQKTVCRVSLNHQSLPNTIEYNYGYSFSGTPYRLYKAVPLAEMGTLQPFFDETLHYLADKFGHWKQTNLRSLHQSNIYQAVFDEEVRHFLLTNGLPDEVVALDETADHDEDNLLDAAVQPAYSIGDIAAKTHIKQNTIAQWVAAIERKGQGVFYGPPGTGKTFMAQQLAQHIIGGGDGFSELVQFHPAYAYEDFMMGLRPVNDDNGALTYQQVAGRFVDFCRRAEGRDRCVLIIDELNRANLARVFGELMYLLEYRDAEISLAGGELFRIPSNVRIIGTMNTADRSIALIDHALRRRFAFIKLQPDFDMLRHYHHGRAYPVEPLITILEALNEAISDPNYHVGTTFFLDEAAVLPLVWQMEIEPYLDEYFFSQPEKIAPFRWSRIRAQLAD